MRILHVESGLNWGGQEYRTVIEAEWLNRNGHQAWIACDPRSKTRVQASERGVPLLPFRLSPRYNLASSLRLLWFCRRNRIDVVHTHSSKDAWICLPLHVLGHKVVRSRNVTNAVGGRARAFIYRHGCSQVIATADLIRDGLIRETRLPAARITVVGEGVQLERFHPGVRPAGLGTGVDRRDFGPLVGMIGMLRGEKGADVFVEAAGIVLRRFPTARFVLVGDGPQRSRVQAQINTVLKTLGAGMGGGPAPIWLAGYREDIPAVLAALDLLVIPSHQEARCRVISEAFAMAKPVVATRVGGIPEVVRDGENGLLVPSGQPQAVAVAINKLIADETLRNRLAAQGFADARSLHSLEHSMQQTVGVYRSLIASPPRGVPPEPCLASLRLGDTGSSDS